MDATGIGPVAGRDEGYTRSLGRGAAGGEDAVRQATRGAGCCHRGTMVAPARRPFPTGQPGAGRRRCARPGSAAPRRSSNRAVVIAGPGAVAEHDLAQRPHQDRTAQTHGQAAGRPFPPWAQAPLGRTWSAAGEHQSWTG